MRFLIFGSFITDIADTVTEYASMSVDALLEATVYKWLYYLVCGLCKLVYYLDRMFQVFSGQTRVQYDGSSTFLVNVFFENHTVSNVYWGMAMIGVVLAFTVAIVAVARKIFDGRDKDQRSLGQILGSLAKSLLLILTMNIIMIVVLSFTNVLMQQITYVFDYAEDLNKDPSIDFTDEQYASMGKILNTIGNYSLNPSADSTYNINSCFNEIRGELNYLNNQGVFDFDYVTKDANGKEIDTWQSILEEIAFSANLSRELKIDVYYESVSRAIKHAMKVIEDNPGGFKPLSHYDRHFKVKSDNIPMDRYAFLLGTLSAAKNDKFNDKPTITDGLRGPYFYGDKSIYDVESAMNDFNFAIGSGGYSYLINLLVVVALIWNLAVIIFACVTRLFMLMVLYLIGPLAFAVEPLDDGEKRKQWTIAFTVQAFSVIGTVVAMRVLLMFIPIIIDTKLVLFDNAVLDSLGKCILLVGGFIVAKKASGVITGILANSAGMQSINHEAGSWGDKALMAPFKLGSAALSVAKVGGKAAVGVTKGAGGVLKWGYNKIGGSSDKEGSSNNEGSGPEGSLPNNNHK